MPVEAHPLLFRLIPPRTDFTCRSCGLTFEAETEEVTYDRAFFASASCPGCGARCSFCFWLFRDCPTCQYFMPARPSRPCAIISGGQTLEDKYKPCSLWIPAADHLLEERADLLRRTCHAGLSAHRPGTDGGP